jgi:poly-beta-1,6-N-acetyl-D-glucosamine synthase
MIRCTLGVLAYNEANNVERTLRALLAQQMYDGIEVVQIIVIASGCTDATVELAESVASTNPIITVEVEPQRTGKAAAIKRLMAMAQGDVIVLVGADTLPEPTAISHLVQPFEDPTVGMTGARVIPLNTPSSWLGFAVQMLWHVHHRLALRKPKLGELIAFRNVLDNFPDDTATDEPAIEALIATKGLRLIYAPKAIVYNRGPEDPQEFLIQRRRIFAGEVRIAMRYGYFTPSMSMRYVIPVAIEAIRSYPRFFSWICAAMAVELWARVLGLYDGISGHEDVVWRAATSTKKVSASSESLTLISVKWPPGALDSTAFLRELQKQSELRDSVFWWDGVQGEILLSVPGQDSSLELFLHRIEDVTQEQTWPRRIAYPGRVSCRMVRFPSGLSG